MAEPSSPPPMYSPSLSIAPPPSSPPTSPRMNSPPVSIAPLPPSSSHSQPTPATMNSPSLSITPPLPSQPAPSPMNSPSLSMAHPPLSQSYSQPTPLINTNPNHKYYQSAGSDELIFHNSKNFELSQVPMRIMFYLNNSWQDFKDEVLEALRYGFANGNAIFPLKIEGSMYVFDFLRMLQVHFNSMSHRSIAWIDENGKSFFPIKSIDHDFSKIVEDHVVVAKQLSLAQASRFPNAKLLNKSDKTYAYINNLFMNNVVNIDPHATITSIHEFQISTPYGRACWDTFEKQIEITEAARGKANVVYGWYATTAENVASEKQIEITEAARGKTNVVYGWYATTAENVASIFYDGFKLLPNTLHPTIRAGIFLADLESPQHRYVLTPST
ncbi:hypothetical protein L195_g039761 [Trifolium pratense]|uniref:RCD1 WWE domain-containing protein n=1 Tax=Trifolium pratense TaxID=57577 RepID=A0A2K3LYU5_TRIPR|nr:hypothetical protein L195_g039761 [Trifolium pratense]